MDLRTCAQRGTARRAAIALVLALVLGALAVGCGERGSGRDDVGAPGSSGTGGPAPDASPTALATTIRLATTTSARDTGLLDVLLPEFRKDTGVQVQYVAVGTGEALKLGERGDADAVLVHARAAEDAFVAAGHGVERRDVWWNRFAVYGLREDPASAGFRMEAGAAGESRAVERSAADALRQIRSKGATFVSRGDRSGTHMKELALWGGKVDPWPGYLETGQGMGPTLVAADEKGAYVLADEGTYLRMRARLRLVPLVSADPALRNPYGAIVVRPDPQAPGRFEAARRLVAWLAGPRARELVRGFTIEGERPFFLPDEVPPAPAPGGR